MGPARVTWLLSLLVAVQLAAGDWALLAVVIFSGVSGGRVRIIRSSAERGASSHGTTNGGQELRCVKEVVGVSPPQCSKGLRSHEHNVSPWILSRRTLEGLVLKLRHAPLAATVGGDTERGDWGIQLQQIELCGGHVVILDDSNGFAVSLQPGDYLQFVCQLSEFKSQLVRVIGGSRDGRQAFLCGQH